jgi:uncharacterized membrane protein SpoIIM required for sporulation
MTARVVRLADQRCSRRRWRYVYEIWVYSTVAASPALAILIWILLGFISAFVIPSEVGKMYEREGHQSPVTGWSGLWLVPFGVFLIPAIVWFVKVQGALNRHWELHGVTAH